MFGKIGVAREVLVADLATKRSWMRNGWELLSVEREINIECISNLRIPVCTTECFRRSDRRPNFLWHCVQRNGFGSWHSLMCAMIVFLDAQWNVQNVQMWGFCWSWLLNWCPRHSSWLTNALSQNSQKKTFLICWALNRLTFAFCCLGGGNGVAKISVSDAELSSSVVSYSLDGSITVTLSLGFNDNIPFTACSVIGALGTTSTADEEMKFFSLISHWRTLSLKSVYISVRYRQRWHMFVGRQSFGDTWRRRSQLWSLKKYWNWKLRGAGRVDVW